MRKTFLAPLTGALAVVMIVFLAGCAQSAQGVGAADPQKLLIPRWFLRELTLNGQKVDLPADQQKITIQFKEDGTVNGSGGCNSFGADYKAGKDGKFSFSPITSTLMACQEGGQLESAYFEALVKVQQFKTEAGKLTLSSADGKTVMVFSMPPK